MGHRILIIQRHRIFSQGLQEMLVRRRNVELVEIAQQGSDVSKLLREKEFDTVIIDAEEGDKAGPEGYAFLKDSPDIKVIVLAQDDSSMHAYGKRAVKDADMTMLLGEMKDWTPRRRPSGPKPELGVGSVVTNTLAALEIVRAGEEIGLHDLADALGWSRTNTRSLVQVLEREAYLQRDPASRKYRLGLKLFELGSAAVGSLGLREVALPVMERMGSATGANVHLGVFDKDRGVVVYIEQVDAEVPVRYLGIGSVVPAHCGAVGKAILAFQRQETIDAYCSRPLEARTAATIVDPQALREELDLVRRQGYAFNDQEWHVGIFGVGAPIRNHNRQVIAAVSLNGLSAIYTTERIEEHVRLVVEMADDISTELGFSRGS